jgi:hypothetical protein
MEHMEKNNIFPLKFLATWLNFGSLISLIKKIVFILVL